MSPTLTAGSLSEPGRDNERVPFVSHVYEWLPWQLPQAVKTPGITGTPGNLLYPVCTTGRWPRGK